MLNQINKALLGVLAHALFGVERQNSNNLNMKALLDEARAQSVFGIVFSDIQNEISVSLDRKHFEHYNNMYMSELILNIQNHENHTEVGELMDKYGIPYCIMKGVASASYYPEPSLRTMGDVDLIVNQEDVEKARSAIESIGYSTDEMDFKGKHIGYKREPLDILELHRSVNGVPNGKIGELISQDIQQLYKNTVELDDFARCRIPNQYYHGLIMLLHMISHMTSEGIGLRHLCDWAVFVNSISNNEFIILFSEKLNSFGLWRFAQIMTATSEKYLGIEHKEWIESAELDDDLLEDVITDILNGGNFGKKDLNRYREIKYISNRNERTVDSKSVLLQAFDAVNKKACDDFRFIGKHRLLLPIGWLAEGGKYFGLLVTGKRKSKGTSKMLKEAAKRKNIYSTMELFVDNQKI